MNNKSEAKRLIVNTVLIAFGNFGSKLISFLLLPLYTSILSTESYGLYDFIITLSTFLTPIISLSIYESLFRFLIEAKNDEAKVKNVISSSLIITVICIGIYILSSLVIYKITKLAYIPVLTLYVIAGIVYLYLISILRGIDKIKFYAIYSGIKNACQVILSYVAVVHLNSGINGLLYATIITSLAISIIIIIQFKLWKYLSLKKKDIRMTKQMIKYSIPLVPDSVSATVVSMSDRIVVREFLGSSQNGIYSIAHKFPSVIEVVYHFFITAWNESASRVYESNKENVQEYYQSLYEFTQKILIGAIIGITAFMPILFKLLIRGDYVQAFEYVPYLLIAQLLNSIANFYSGILIANKDTKKIAKSTIIAAVVNIILNLVLVKYWNIYGVLIATVISNIILVLLRKMNSNKYVKLNENYKYLLLVFITFAIILLLYRYDNILMCLISIMIAVVFFCKSNSKIIIVLCKTIKNKISKR